MEKLLLTTADCVRVASLSETTIKALIASGELESVKIGRARRIPVDSLRAWIEGQRAGEEF